MKHGFFRTAAAVVAAVFLCLPARAANFSGSVSARSAILVDAQTGRVLYEKNADEQSLIASTTKIMTGLLVCEAGELEREISVPPEAAGVEGSSLYLKAGERIDDLQRDGLRIIQREDGFRFGTDAVLLADFAAVRRGERVCDMGTGTGVLPLLLSARAEGTTFDAFEVQRDVADMAQRSVALNGLQARIRVHHADCREAGRIIGCETVQLVVTNPPYTALGAGLVSPEETRALSRSDSDCPLADWMAACARVLQNGGRLCAVFPAPRFLALCDAMRGAKVEPKRVRFIVSRPESAPKLVLVEGKKRGRPGLHLLPMLVTHTADGGFTEEMRRIYGEL